MQSIIKSIEFTREWTGPNGVLFYHNIEMENGDKGQIGTKSKLPEKLQVGKSLDYETTKDEKGNVKIKALQLPNGVQKGGFKQDPEVEAHKQRMIVAQSSLSAAVQFYQQRSGVDAFGVQETAREFYNFVMDISK